MQRPCYQATGVSEGVRPGPHRQRRIRLMCASPWVALSGPCVSRTAWQGRRVPLPREKKAVVRASAQQLTPSAEDVAERLDAAVGFPRHGNPSNVFFCLIYVVLSAKTSIPQATRTLRELRRRWPTAGALAVATQTELGRVIAPCGLASLRAPRILAIARAVNSAPSRFETDTLRKLSDDELENVLVGLPGVGPKTARVVAAMSLLRRDRFAVDTHAWRVSLRLGWVAEPGVRRVPTTPRANTLEARVPKVLRRRLHAQLVSVGREWCRRTPNCGACPLREICTYSLRHASCAPDPP
jgi:endonuclease III